MILLAHMTTAHSSEQYPRPIDEIGSIGGGAPRGSNHFHPFLMQHYRDTIDQLSMGLYSDDSAPSPTADIAECLDIDAETLRLYEFINQGRQH